MPDIALSHTAIYKHISANKARGCSLYKNLPCFGKKHCKGCKGKAMRTITQVDINDRPEEVDLRSSWPIGGGDTVYGQDAHLATLVDRNNRLKLIEIVDRNHC